MGWMQTLCETYDALVASEAISDDQHPLTPMGFTRIMPDYHVTLSSEGKFLQMLPYGDEGKICVPTLPKAEGRTGNPAPYPLFDELRYMAGDFTTLCGGGEDAWYDAYMAQLEGWCAAPDAPAQLKTLLAYLSGKTLAADFLASFPKLAEEPEKSLKKNEKKKLCFSVLGERLDEERDLWKRADIRTSWSQYFMGQLDGDGGETALCYVTGEHHAVTETHPKVDGNAKLISAKEGGAIKYSGRYEDSVQALSISWAASAKAHNMLKWLMERPGIRTNFFGMRLLCWSSNGAEITTPFDDVTTYLGGGDTVIDTGDAFARLLAEATAGRRAKLFDQDANRPSRVTIMILRVPVPGRISIVYYQELDGSDYLEKLEKWYASCRARMWREGRMQMSSPTPTQIAAAIHGANALRIAKADRKNEKAASKMVRQTYERLLPCITGGAPLPADMLAAAFNNACRPLSFTNKDGEWQYFDWQSAIAVTCALIHKVNKERNGEMKTIQKDNQRARAFGRLLAVADMAERRAAQGDDAGKGYRQTNAVRYMQRMKQRPADTWDRLFTQLLQPYMKKLGEKSGYYERLICNIASGMDDGAISDNTPLGPAFLEGYYKQMNSLYAQKIADKQKKANDNEEVMTNE